MPSRTIVAVSNEYGAGGAAIGKAAADALGFELVDEQLPVIIARRLQISERDAEAAEDTRRSVGERVLTSLERATPELAMPSLGAEFDDRYLAEIRRAVLEYAARGRVVIIGRGGGAILGRRPDTLRAFLYAPRPWRIERIVEVHGVDESTAAEELDRIDAARRAHLRDVFGLNLGDPHNYDLCLDVAQLGLNGSAGVIVDAVRAGA